MLIKWLRSHLLGLIVISIIVLVVVFRAGPRFDEDPPKASIFYDHEQSPNKTNWLGVGLNGSSRQEVPTRSGQLPNPRISEVRPDRMTARPGPSLFTEKGLGKNAQLVIRRQRDEIALELSDYLFNNKTLEELLPDYGGTPLSTLVVTTWRSGSTFVGDVLNSHPAMYYHYEPLSQFSMERARNRTLADKAVKLLNNLLNCDYSQIDDYMADARYHSYVFAHNSRLWRHCRAGRRALCWQPAFLSRFCRLFPFQTAKTVRLPLAGAGRLLADQPSLRVLLLVRDPRGTLQSRRHHQWCSGNPDCEDPERLCGDLEEDFWTAQRLREIYGTDRLRLLRYEDFSIGVATNAPALMTFAGLQYHPMVQRFVDTHTTAKSSNAGGYSTFRNSTTTPFKWVRSLPWSKVDFIQKKCAEAMRLWGYKTITKEEWNEWNRDKTKPLQLDTFVADLHLKNML